MRSYTVEYDLGDPQIAEFFTPGRELLGALANELPGVKALEGRIEEIEIDPERDRVRVIVTTRP